MKPLRAFIVATYGEERVREAEARLCRTCRFAESQICAPNPSLLPLTTEGKDCPYYVPKRFGATRATGQR